MGSAKPAAAPWTFPRARPTACSFELGIGRLGGHAVWMDWNTSNFSISPIEYEARYASTQMDLIMARLKRHEDLLTLARHSTVPVINGCDDRYHPCQALADILTVYEAAGGFDRAAVTYVGIHNNVIKEIPTLNSGKIDYKKLSIN